MICGVSGEGKLCVKQASENVLCVVGTRAIKSYAWNSETFAFICQSTMNCILVAGI